MQAITPTSNSHSISNISHGKSRYSTFSTPTTIFMVQTADQSADITYNELKAQLSTYKITWHQLVLRYFY